MGEYRSFEFHKLKEMVVEIFKRYSYSDEDAKIIADVMLTSDLMGIESHGVQRLTLYPFGIKIGRIKVDAEMKILKESPTTVVIDADAGMGHLAGTKAMQMAIRKAKEMGIGMAVVRNSNHYGIAGYYSMMAAKEGLLGISMTNTQALVVPTFGKTPLLGTNPIAVTMPAEPVPFHLDMSTSVVTGGKMEVYAKNKQPVPEGWAVDSTGAVNTDAQVFVNNRGKSSGGLLPLGGAGELYSGHKGYGLSMVVEIMTGILSTGVTSAFVRKEKNVEQCCHMFMAIDYGRFTDDKKAMEAQLSEYMEMLRSSEKVEGAERIYTHGEKEQECQERVLREGVQMNEATYQEIVNVCKERGVDYNKYLVEVKKG